MRQTYRLYRKSYKDRRGRIQEARTWTIEFRDCRHRPRRLALFRDKAASGECARRIVQLVQYHVGSGGQVDPSLTTWLAGLPVSIKQKLAKIGVLPPERFAAAKLLTEHLADFKKAQEAKDITARQVDLVQGRLKKLTDGCGFRYFADISGNRVAAWLHEQRQDIKEKRGISAQTSNFYLSALKSFCRWMQKEKRSHENPVAHLEPLNVATDRRHDRRAFTVEELQKLLTVAQQGPERKGMSGPERVLLYRLAMETGLRSSELRSLTRASFKLDGSRPVVVVMAGYSKRRREDTLPLRPDLAKDLKTFLAMKTPHTAVFSMPRRDRVAKMLKADLDAAEIPYRDADNRVGDFHALRHSFISNLARGGVSPKLAQDLARHSDINLTMTRYSHTLLDEQAAALAALPDLSKPLKATGTQGPPGSFNPPGQGRVEPGDKGVEEVYGRVAGRDGMDGQGTLMDSNGLRLFLAKICAAAEKAGKTWISSGGRKNRTCSGMTPSPVFQTGALPVGQPSRESCKRAKPLDGVLR